MPAPSPSSRSVMTVAKPSRAGQFEEGVEIGGERGDTLLVADALLNALALLHNLLALLGLVPEAGRGGLLFCLLEFGFQRGGVKDTSAQPRPVRGGGCTGVPNRQAGSFQFNFSRPAKWGGRP